ncbi:MAG: hypothetical protein ACOCV0_04830 [Alkalispirochaeta sp.]
MKSVSDTRGNPLSSRRIIERLARGYALLFTGIIRAAATLAILVAVSAVVTLPLWYGAHYLPGVFNTVVIVGVVIGAVFAFRRVMTGAVWFRIALVVLAGTLITTAVTGLLGVSVAAGVAITGLIAWRVVPN